MRGLALAIAGALLVAVLFLAYVGWNAVAAPRIDAFQGRYLLLVVAVLAVVVAPGIDFDVGLDAKRGAAVVVASSAAVAFAVAVGIARFVYF